MEINQRFDDIRNILVLRTDGIGDVLNSTPAISALRKTYPDAHITAVVKPYGAEMLSQNSDVDEIIIYDPQSQHKKLMDKVYFLRKLRSNGYDTVLVLNNSSLSNFMAYVSGARIRVGRRSEPKRFNHTLTHWVNRRDPKGTKHEIDRNLDVVYLLNVKNGTRNLVLHFTEEEKTYAEDFLRLNNLREKRDNGFLFRLVGIHSGGSSCDKLWPSEYFAEIADRLIDEFNARVILFTGPSEKALAQNILSNVKHPMTLASGINLRQLAVLIGRCSLFICNDSGPMHIASALRVPIVAIFGSTDYVRWRPQNENAVVVRKDMDCWPCSAHKCKRNYECTKTLPVSQVWNAIMELTSNTFL